MWKIFGDPNKKRLNKIQPIVDQVNKLESKFEHFSNEELKEKTQEFKNRLKKETLDQILPEAFALVREAAKRTLSQRHYDVQLIGGIVMHQGDIAEMKTGEGKTLAATLPLYLNALTEKGVHLVTVNDYLARRDTIWMGQIYNLLGLTTACINHEAAYIYDPEYKEQDEQRDELGSFKIFEEFLRPVERKKAYQADILYGTNNEFGFDYLRDNMAYDKETLTQREFNYAIIDEIDSILIDEARTPLIISAPDTESADLYKKFATLVPRLKKQEDYEVDEKSKAVTLTNKGIDKIEGMLNIDNIYQEKGIQMVHHLEQALKAHVIFKKDKDYIVKNGEIILVDEFTGRLTPGRRYSGGLHQAIEAKEGVEVKRESKTMASITFQNFFRMYDKLSGMTGTALSNAEEFDKTYGLDVVVIPTNRPMIRKDHPDVIYKTEKAKFRAVIEKIRECNKKQQPVLVGTVSIDKNELLGHLLKTQGISCNILNAKNHEKEGEIIAQAGKPGAVTIATNMAGRGVDIVLGGNPPEQPEKVKEAGGLFIIGTERHEARRIDNQLRGRAGRQGDPGESQFFVSLEDELMVRFGSERIKRMMDVMKMPEDQPIQNKMISGAIEKSQSRIEGYNLDIREHVLKYDEVINKQREAIYRMRKKILFSTSQEIENRIKELMTEEEQKKYEKKETSTERFIMLRTIDIFWMEHLQAMECLRQSASLQAYGQKDPLVEYKSQGKRMFDQMVNNIDNSIVETLIKADVRLQKQQPQTPISKSKKVGRNDPCPCGSGKKYKKCCGK
ncbi:MAG: preprotein translocase subunit SecA [Candidatus Portnoybacteria bacterium]|nr:preprotein translocase subunit SecA [Candidatus Portnoybacteria bacterium]